MIALVFANQLRMEDIAFARHSEVDCEEAKEKSSIELTIPATVISRAKNFKDNPVLISKLVCGKDELIRPFPAAMMTSGVIPIDTCENGARATFQIGFFNSNIGEFISCSKKFTCRNNNFADDVIMKDAVLTEEDCINEYTVPLLDMHSPEEKIRELKAAHSERVKKVLAGRNSKETVHSDSLLQEFEPEEEETVKTRDRVQNTLDEKSK